tara:strand:- start:8485 stop:9462 length:978 start_codon:yes stop_codon:yes gene_type:complete
MEHNHEENIKKEFEKAEGLPINKVTDLGKVKPSSVRNKITADDPEIKRINEITGHQRINLSLLPSGGKFYRSDFELFIRAARVGEIREFSTLNEQDIRDVDDKLNSIVSNCTKIMYGSQRGSYKDILEEDRVFVILSIKELTFKNGEQKLMMPVTKKSCKNSSCKSQKSVELKTDMLQFEKVKDTVEKYYDHEYKCYNIRTKNHGNILMAPPTIGVMRAITDFAREKEKEGASWDKSILSVLPYLQRDWRECNDKSIFKAMTSLQGWNTSKYSIVYRLAEQMKVGVKIEMNFPCNSCGDEVTVPLTFPGGVKSLFIIQDISSELL